MKVLGLRVNFALNNYTTSSDNHYSVSCGGKAIGSIYVSTCLFEQYLLNQLTFEVD